jgi:uncharacterized membrane protein
MERTSIGLAENVAGLLCYVLGWVSGLISILLEPENKFVRFHAAQSMIVFSALAITSFVLTLVPFIGLILAGLVSALGFILSIVLMVKAYQGAMYKLPWVGDQAEKWLSQQH